MRPGGSVYARSQRSPDPSIPHGHGASTSIASLGALHLYATLLYSHFEGSQRLIGRRRERLARAHAESRSVPRTDDPTRLHLGALQGLTIVRAAILYRVEVGAAAYNEEG